MRDQERVRFDELLDEIVASLPDAITAMLQEKPVLVEDRPSVTLLGDLGLPREAQEELCGLHSGPMLTERTTEGDSGDIQVIHLFREGIITAAGGWIPCKDPAQTFGGEAAVEKEIRITLLHEIGHHFGLDEEDLEELGFA